MAGTVAGTGVEGVVPGAGAEGVVPYSLVVAGMVVAGLVVAGLVVAGILVAGLVVAGKPYLLGIVAVAEKLNGKINERKIYNTPLQYTKMSCYKLVFYLVLKNAAPTCGKKQLPGLKSVALQISSSI